MTWWDGRSSLLRKPQWAQDDSDAISEEKNVLQRPVSVGLAHKRDTKERGENVVQNG